MATFEEGLFSLLNAAPSIQALSFSGVPFFDGANCRIYPVTISEKSDLPALAFLRVGGSRGLTMQGKDGIVKARFQFSAAGLAADDCIVLLDAVLDLLHGYQGTLSNGVIVQEIGVMLDPFDTFNAEARLFERHCDLEVIYKN